MKDDSLFVKSCRQLMAQNEKVVTMPQFEFRNICDNKLERTEKRISSYKQVWLLSVLLLSHFVIFPGAIHIR